MLDIIAIVIAVLAIMVAGAALMVRRRPTPPALEVFKNTSGRAPKEDVLARARALREKIRQRVGLLDVVELLEESRRSHPFDPSHTGRTQDKP